MCIFKISLVDNIQWDTVNSIKLFSNTFNSIYKINRQFNPSIFQQPILSIQSVFFPTIDSVNSIFQIEDLVKGQYSMKYSQFNTSSFQQPIPQINLSSLRQLDPNIKFHTYYQVNWKNHRIILCSKSRQCVWLHNISQFSKSIILYQKMDRERCSSD